MKSGIVVLAVLALLVLVAGCTETERRGYSPIPQNSPGAWEVNPYN